MLYVQQGLVAVVRRHTAVWTGNGCFSPALDGCDHLHVRRDATSASRGQRKSHHCDAVRRSGGAAACVTRRSSSPCFAVHAALLVGLDLTPGAGATLSCQMQERQCKDSYALDSRVSTRRGSDRNHRIILLQLDFKPGVSSQRLRIQCVRCSASRMPECWHVRNLLCNESAWKRDVLQLQQNKLPDVVHISLDRQHRVLSRTDRLKRRLFCVTNDVRHSTHS